jgi:glycerol-3-phosphate dehydrogenase
MLGRALDDQGSEIFRPGVLPPMPSLSPAQQRRLAGRHGRELPDLLALLDEVGSERVAGSDTLWVELAWAAQNELVLHLDDLLLRRTRLGLLLTEGAKAELPRIRALCQARLGWDDTRWGSEERDYLELWRCCYSLPTK